MKESDNLVICVYSYINMLAKFHLLKMVPCAEFRHMHSIILKNSDLYLLKTWFRPFITSL